jgi:hypothetical protein
LKSARSWSSKPAQPSDLDAIRALHAQVFGGARPVEHDLWKFVENPAGPSIVMLAEHNGEIVGQYALLPARLRLGNEVVLGAQSLDTMVRSDFRGQGMFTVLALECFELARSRGVEVLYGFPNDNSYPGFIRSLNWDHTGDVCRWARPLSLSDHPRIPKVAAPFVDLLTRLLPSGHFQRNDTTIQPERPDPAKLDALLSRWREVKRRCRVERDEKWFDWRFSERSQRGYQYLSVYRRGTLAAVAIWTPTTGRIAELLGDDAVALEAAVAMIVSLARGSGLSAVSTVTNDAICVQVLRACGFLRREQIPYIVRTLSTRNLDGNIHDHASWVISASDLDTF